MAQSILIVDDEKEIVSMLYCYFSKLGYTVYTATAGNAALKEVEKKPDIILLDVNMPDIDGFTVCERIRDYVSLLLTQVRCVLHNGYVNDFTDERRHHEIYLSDPRKVAPEKCKTVIRHPIKKA